MSDEPDVCLSCQRGSDADGETFGFCSSCQVDGRAEIYLAHLALQEGDEDDARKLMAKAREKRIPPGVGA